MNLQIRLAKNTETKQIVDFLREVASWLKSKEINQWSYLLSGGEDDAIERAILNKETYIAECDDQLVGTFTISPVQSDWDIDIWGERKDSSLYLHRLAVSTDYKGNGLGSEMIQWMEEMFADQYIYLRLDCVSTNRKLNQFYQTCGYKLVGSADGFNKYEKRLR